MISREIFDLYIIMLSPSLTMADVSLTVYRLAKSHFAFHLDRNELNVIERERKACLVK